MTNVNFSKPNVNSKWSGFWLYRNLSSLYSIHAPMNFIHGLKFGPAIMIWLRTYINFFWWESYGFFFGPKSLLFLVKTIVSSIFVKMNAFFNPKWMNVPNFSFQTHY
jgi:hypothetical protein